MRQTFLVETNKPPDITEFESEAEETAFGILSDLSAELGFEINYQFEVMENEPLRFHWRDWVIDKWDGFIPDWADHSKTPGSCSGSRNDEGCAYCYSTGGYEFEKYRLDFVLTKGSRKLNLEIDGRDWHNDKIYDNDRDNYIKTVLGFNVKRFMGSDVYYKKGIKIRSFMTKWALKNLP